MVNVPSNKRQNIIIRLVHTKRDSFVHYTVHCVIATTRQRRQKEMRSSKVLKIFSNGSNPVLAMKQLGAVVLFLCLLRMAFTSSAIQVEDGRYLDPEVI
jgi:hypothetical protein